MYTKRYKPEDIKDGKCPECGDKRFLYRGSFVQCTNCGEKIGESFNKYGAKKQEYKGHKYDSKFEANIAQDLDLKLNAGEILEVQRQVRIPLYAYGIKVFTYIIDFIVKHKDGHLEYIEAKGYETDIWKAKWKMLEAKLAKEEPTSEMTLIKQGR